MVGFQAANNVGDWIKFWGGGVCWKEKYGKSEKQT